MCIGVPPADLDITTVLCYTAKFLTEEIHNGLMQQSQLYYNLYQTSMLICLMPSGWKIASVTWGNSEGLRMVRYTMVMFAMKFDTSRS